MDVLTVFNSINADTRVVAVLKKKFELVSIELKKVLKIASKGERKGQLIFTSTAAREIYQIEDKFVKFIVRSIFDNYTDVRNGILWRMHYNEIFTGDFQKEIYMEINETIRELENKLKFFKDNEYNTVEYLELAKVQDKYSRYNSRNPENVFNKNNPLSEKFYSELNAFYEKVKADHPRVQNLAKYVDDDYTYRNEKSKIEENFLNSFPEYAKNHEDMSNHYTKTMNQQREITEQIKVEMKKENFDTIKAEVEKMVTNFAQLICNSIINNTI